MSDDKKKVPLLEFSITYPKTLTAILVLGALLLLTLVVLPTIAPSRFPMLSPLKIDTDPENMLSEDTPVRVFHHKMKETLELHDMIVVGVVNETHPEGVFNPESLAHIHEITEFSKTLQWPSKEDPERMEGVVARDIMSLSVVDNIEQAGIGTVRFEWLMPEPPQTQEEALAIREKVQRLPFLQGTLISEDGKAVAIYLPITQKSLSYRVKTALEEKIATFEGDDQFHITGLPVAEDTFGVEMFYQMAVSAPLAMLVIFLLMWWFFRKLVLIISPLLLALITVIWTMGLLIVTGNTVHIMSSMIPIFIMPIAVLDSIHILSEFFERYSETRDRRKTIEQVMRTLFTAMLFTSLTSLAGFASLALTPIPPVQVFGIFVAVGIALAWLFTVTFIPAYIMLLPQRTLEKFGRPVARHLATEEHATLSDRFLRWVGEWSYSRARTVVVAALVFCAVAIYGISQININDNPTKWFNAKHPIRVADRVLNEHFGGTYMAFLALRPGERPVADLAAEEWSRIESFVEENAGDNPALRDALATIKPVWDAEAEKATAYPSVIDAAVKLTEDKLDTAEGDVAYAWEDLLNQLDEAAGRQEIFKQPETLAYMEKLQAHLVQSHLVGKSNSVADLIKTVHRELLGGEEAEYRIPDSANAVAQCLVTYESSHRPYDLWHFVTPDYQQASIWVQLKSGDNRDMSSVVADVDAFFAANPAPFALEKDWFGLTYINVIWQEEMVTGMLQSFLGSFLVVMLMMTLLYRSALWGLLSMIPLTLTIGLIYGVIGLVGKDYDMPVAVLSSLTLGLAVDFAIHFLSRTRTLYAEHGSFDAIHSKLFGEPAQAIFRNIVVIAVGFLPLLASTLVPYKTVGILLATILGVAGVGTLVLLPALVKLAERLLFPKTVMCSLTCQFMTLAISMALFVAFVVINVHQFLGMTWEPLAIAGGIVVLLSLPVFWILARRKACMSAAQE